MVKVIGGLGIASILKGLHTLTVDCTLKRYYSYKIMTIIKYNPSIVAWIILGILLIGLSVLVKRREDKNKPIVSRLTEEEKRLIAKGLEMEKKEKEEQEELIEIGRQAKEKMLEEERKRQEEDDREYDKALKRVLSVWKNEEKEKEEKKREKVEQIIEEVTELCPHCETEAIIYEGECTECGNNIYDDVEEIEEEEEILSPATKKKIEEVQEVKKDSEEFIRFQMNML